MNPLGSEIMEALSDYLGVDQYFLEKVLTRLVKEENELYLKKARRDYKKSGGTPFHLKEEHR